MQMSDAYRYLFLLREIPGSEFPEVDAFYQMKMPAGITDDEFAIMRKLDETYLANELENDNFAFKGMALRLRFNNDIYANIYLVKTSYILSTHLLNEFIIGKYKNNELSDFLKLSKV